MRSTRFKKRYDYRSDWKPGQDSRIRIIEGFLPFVGLLAGVVGLVVFLVWLIETFVKV